jgi:hypothetical protein
MLFREMIRVCCQNQPNTYHTVNTMRAVFMLTIWCVQQRTSDQSVASGQSVPCRTVLRCQRKTFEMRK